MNALRKYSIPDVIIGGDKDCKHEFEILNHPAKGGRNTIENPPNVSGNQSEQQEDISIRFGYKSNICKCGAWKGQYGLEPHFSDYVEHTRLWAKEAWRVLRNDGIFFLNLADSYTGGGKGNYGHGIDSSIKAKQHPKGNDFDYGETPSKCQLLIPHRVAISLVEDGWTLRNTIVWYKPNAMPESVTDRFSKKYEYIFMFTKQEKYYFDLDSVREKCSSVNKLRNKNSELSNNGYIGDRFSKGERPEQHPLGKNPGDVWQIPTQPFKEAHYACVTPDTEILTIEGWKKYTDIQWYESSPKHILVATYNLQKQIIEYQRLSYIKEYDFNGELVKIGNSSLDILMTPNHRNIVKKQTEIEVVVLAENLSHMDKIRVLAPVVYPENCGIGETLAELIGFIISEGHYKKGGYIEIYQQEGKMQSERIDFLLNKLEIPHTKHSRNRKDRERKLITWFLKKSPLIEWILQNVPPKKLTQYLVSLPLNETKALFNGLIAGDGHIRKDDGRICFIQKDRETQGWFQILAMRLGYHSLASGLYVLLTKKQWIGIRNTNGKGKSVKKISYQGKVWCPKTPNGTWVARRNGRIFITGNTWPERLVERMVKCSTKAGDTVLDCFAGSSTTGIVAESLHRKFIGIELGYEDIHKRRMSKIQKQMFI